MGLDCFAFFCSIMLHGGSWLVRAGVGLVRAEVGLFSKEHCSFFRGVGVAVGGGSSISIISLSFLIEK